MRRMKRPITTQITLKILKNYFKFLIKISNRKLEAAITIEYFRIFLELETAITKRLFIKLFLLFRKAQYLNKSTKKLSEKRKYKRR